MTHEEYSVIIKEQLSTFPSPGLTCKLKVVFEVVFAFIEWMRGITLFDFEDLDSEPAQAMGLESWNNLQLVVVSVPQTMASMNKTFVLFVGVTEAAKTWFPSTFVCWITVPLVALLLIVYALVNIFWYWRVTAQLYVVDATPEMRTRRDCVAVSTSIVNVAAEEEFELIVGVPIKVIFPDDLLAVAVKLPPTALLWLLCAPTIFPMTVMDSFVFKATDARVCVELSDVCKPF